MRLNTPKYKQFNKKYRQVVHLDGIFIRIGKRVRRLGYERN
ncbi:hypothetical protein AO384_0404 [Moraxella catarrhalis]|uniref:Uncharacterized protein n=1 Tax=Moraxella catarrhalis TaxID=480 RepID=A0A198UMK2_MORCA|nr:hypothetical protein AO384_0404 [Moraxella catarrhalis]